MSAKLLVLTFSHIHTVKHGTAYASSDETACGRCTPGKRSTAQPDGSYNIENATVSARSCTKSRMALLERSCAMFGPVPGGDSGHARRASSSHKQLTSPQAQRSQGRFSPRPVPDRAPRSRLAGRARARTTVPRRRRPTLAIDASFTTTARRIPRAAPRSHVALAARPR